MRDRSLGMLLMVLFGVLGVSVLLLAWLWTAPGSERVAATLAGVAGVGMSLAQLPALRSNQTAAGTKLPAEAGEK